MGYRYIFFKLAQYDPCFNMKEKWYFITPDISFNLYYMAFW